MAQTTQDLSAQLWSQYTALLAAQMGAGASSATIQVLPSGQLLFPVTAADGTKDYTQAIQQFVGVVPQWGAIYAPSDETVIDAYQAVLTQLQETATSGNSIEAEYQAASTKLTALMGTASAFKIKQIKAYQVDAQTYANAGMQAPSFNDWFVDNGQQEYKNMLDNQTVQATQVQTLLKAASISSPLVSALAKLNVELESTVGNLNHPWTINPLPNALGTWTSNPTNPTTIELNQTASQLDYSKTVWQSQSGVELFGFISINHKVDGGERTSVFNSSESFTISISFAATASFNLTPGDWFNGAILKTYKNGPYISGSQFGTAASHPYNDAAAVFPLLATKAYIVMNPTITITQSKSESSSLFTQLNSSFANGINLGSFAFGGNESSSSSIEQHDSADGSSSSITIKDTSNVPQIVAIVNELMP